MKLILFENDQPASAILFSTQEEAAEWLARELQDHGYELQHIDYHYDVTTQATRLAVFARHAEQKKVTAFAGFELRTFTAYYRSHRQHGNLTLQTQ